LRIPKVATGAIMSVIAAGSLIAAGSGTPAGAYAFGTVTATPATNLVDGHSVTLHISGFGTDTGPTAVPPGETVLYAVQCTGGVLTSVPQGDTTFCDQSKPSETDPSAPLHVGVITNASNGVATASFTVHTGSNFLAPHKGAKCDAQHSCYIVVTDGMTAATTNFAAFVPITFKDLRAATTTKVKAAKSVKIGKKVKVSVTTKGKTAAGSLKGGKVLIKDGSKKCGSVTETASGKVSAKCTVKKGKNHITASFAGNTLYKASKGKATVTGKK
jgi:hypothetical protein